jgi:hypothetical protein
MIRNEEGAKLARDRIAEALDAETTALLDRLNPRARQLQLWQWIREAMQPKWTPGELERFFAKELDTTQRERLLNLPPGEMQSELEQMYLASQLGFRGGLPLGGGPWKVPGPDRPRFRPGARGRTGGPMPEFFDDRFDPRPAGPNNRRHEGRLPADGPPGPPPPRRGSRDAV